MFSHVMIGTNDLEKSRLFYDAVLAVIGAKPGMVDRHRVFWRANGGTFSVSQPIDGQPATRGNGSTVGFAMASPEQADQFHAAAIAHGGVAIEDPPGWRGGPGGMYLCYVRDPDGNKICGLHRPAKA